MIPCLSWLVLVTATGAAIDVPSIARTAEEQLMHGDSEGARTFLQKQLQLAPSEPELWNLLGISDGELGKFDEARDAFTRGLRLSPQSLSLNENIGFLYFRKGDYVTARRYLQRAVELGSDKPGVKFSLAASRLRAGQQQQARAELKGLEGQLASSHEYWEERGNAELPVDTAAAESDFDRALKFDPKSLPALNGAAAAAEKQGLDEKALSFLIEARKIAPDDLGTLAHFGAVCLRRDLGPDAVDALEKAHNLDPANATVLYLLARAHIAVQDWQRSLDLFREFAKQRPNVPTAYYAMGWLEVKLNRAQEARRDLERCLSLAPKTTGAQFELAQMDVNDGETERAERKLRTVLAEDSGHIDANLLLADLLMRRGQLDDAEQHVETALHRDPNSGPAHYKLALVLTRKQQPQRAQEERALAAKLNSAAAKASKTQLRLVLPEELGH